MCSIGPRSALQLFGRLAFQWRQFGLGSRGGYTLLQRSFFRIIAANNVILLRSGHCSHPSETGVAVLVSVGFASSMYQNCGSHINVTGVSLVQQLVPFAQLTRRTKHQGNVKETGRNSSMVTVRVRNNTTVGWHFRFLAHYFLTVEPLLSDASCDKGCHCSTIHVLTNGAP